jgi:hypothetical protein
METIPTLFQNRSLAALLALGLAACGPGGGQGGQDEATTAGQAIMKDNNCAGQSMWLYDTTDRSGHEICFDQAGSVNLASYCRTMGFVLNPFTGTTTYQCTSTWSGAVRSFWSGALSGEFVAPQTGVDQGQFACSESFKSDDAQGFTIADSCVQRATSIGLDNGCIVTGSNILIATGDTAQAPYQLYTLTRSGATAAPPVLIPPSGGDSLYGTSLARDVTVDAEGRRFIYSGTFAPNLAMLSGGVWSNTTLSGWSTVNDQAYGGLAAFGHSIYATDMHTDLSGGEPNGIVRFDTSVGVATRFASGQDYQHVAIGYDLRLYALRAGNAPSGNVIDIFDPNTMTLLGTVTLAEQVLAIAVDAEGFIYGIGYDPSSADRKFYRFSSSGAVLASLASHTGDMLTDLKLASDGTLVAGSFGNIWGSSTIYLTDSAFTQVTPISFPVPRGQWLTTFAAFDEPPPGSCAR